MKHTLNIKAMVAKLFTLGLLAGAVIVAAPKAEAQVSFGVHVGAPVYIAPGYRRPVYVEPAPIYGFYGPRFHNRYAWDRHEEFVRHEELRHEEFRHDHDWR